MDIHDTLPMEPFEINEAVAEHGAISQADVARLYDPNPEFFYAKTRSLGSIWAKAGLFVRFSVLLFGAGIDKGLTALRIALSG